MAQPEDHLTGDVAQSLSCAMGCYIMGTRESDLYTEVTQLSPTDVSNGGKYRLIGPMPDLKANITAKLSKPPLIRRNVHNIASLICGVTFIAIIGRRGLR